MLRLAPSPPAPPPTAAGAPFLPKVTLRLGAPRLAIMFWQAVESAAKQLCPKRPLLSLGPVLPGGAPTPPFGKVPSESAPSLLLAGEGRGCDGGGAEL